jgi:hypothetical protein
MMTEEAEESFVSLILFCDRSWESSVKSVDPTNAELCDGVTAYVLPSCTGSFHIPSEIFGYSTVEMVMITSFLEDLAVTFFKIKDRVPVIIISLMR